MIPRLKAEYEKKIIEDLQKKLSVKNKYMVPKFIKVVLNMGIGFSHDPSIHFLFSIFFIEWKIYCF